MISGVAEMMECRNAVTAAMNVMARAENAVQLIDDFLAECGRAGVRDGFGLRVDQWIRTNQKPAAENGAAGSEALLEALDHHEEMAKHRRQSAEETRSKIARMDADPEQRPQWETPWEQTKAINLRQADFDASWGDKHLRYADAIRASKSDTQILDFIEQHYDIRNGKGLSLRETVLLQMKEEGGTGYISAALPQNI